VGKLLFHKISTILFVAVPLIFIYIQVSDPGSLEPLVNISVIIMLVIMADMAIFNIKLGERFRLLGDSGYNSRSFK
jgi:hypothetical protein